MSSEPDPFLHHPELRDKVTDPITSFFRTFRIESVLAQHPELSWVAEIIHSDDEREQNRLNALQNHPNEDLWVFAYGSLMWDPAFIFSEVRRANVPDYARRFILRDVMGGRGTPEEPGLMAALDHGPGCDGLVFRIPRDIIAVETDILWRRELVAPTYLPTFVTAFVEGQPVRALTFTADHDADQIRIDITRDEQIQYVCGGRGILGTSLEYLTNIVSQFNALGIVDHDCSSLLAEAEKYIGRNN